ncbi:MAG TPA: hypothetical protein VJB87_05300 [Candidatus Nanoarchaeia archaeon]|nr:hypothetical protein [Candidatus Nanoarchaeia archaeon]
MVTRTSQRVYTGENNCGSAPVEELRSFYHADVSVALAASQSRGFSPLWMPSFLEERLAQPNGHPVWGKWSFTPSSLVTGKSRGGARVALVAHIPSYVSDPENIAAARVGGRLVNGALPVADAEVYRLLALEGNGVMVVDHAKLLGAKVGVMPVDETIDHVLTAPFCGSVDLASRYLPRHNEHYGRVSIWFRKEDLQSDVPAARLLLAGGSYFILDADYGLSLSGRFFGVRRNSAVGADAEKT